MIMDRLFDVSASVFVVIINVVVVAFVWNVRTEGKVGEKLDILFLTLYILCARLDDDGRRAA